MTLSRAKSSFAEQDFANGPKRKRLGDQKAAPMVKLSKTGAISSVFRRCSDLAVERLRLETELWTELAGLPKAPLNL